MQHIVCIDFVLSVQIYSLDKGRMAKNWRVQVLVQYLPARLNEFFVRLFNSGTKIPVLTNQKRKETAVKSQ